jgi:hypothetical protein
VGVGACASYSITVPPMRVRAFVCG